MKQFTFTSQLAPIIWKYLESRQNEGYTSVHCGYYMQELDCLSKELSDAPVVTKELIDAWDLLKPYLSNRSKIVRHNAIRAFAKFAYTQDGISYVPDTSKLKNSSTFTPHIFTVEEIRRLLYAADNLPVRNNAPTRHLVIPAVIRLLYCCGFRIGEVLRLRVKDVDLDTGIITVHNGKGGKDRLVPVHNSVIEYLRSYSAQLPDEREWFFPSACGHYSIKTIYDNFRELLFACNIPHTGNGPRVHDFRHTFAVHTLEKQLSDGYDPMVIVPRLAAYLGHMLDSLHLHISQGNCKTVMLTWKSVAPDICDMLFSMPPNMFAFGVLHSRPILKRSVLRESITMLPSLMLLKSW